MKPMIPTRSLPFCSFLFREDLLCAKEFLLPWEDWFKKNIKLHHPFFPMKQFYSKEMGPASCLNRFFFFGLEPFPREILQDGKMKAQEQEDKYKRGNERSVNIDFGILSLENVILATHKPFSHRIYLANGIYQELTYIFQSKTYQILPWTYPDYSHPEILGFFNRLRGLLLKKLKG